MSIQHFVKGKYTCTVKGDYTVYSNENIVHNASKSVDQKGLDKGTSYNGPKDINPNDTPSDTIDVTLNLFFDGTQNNKRNTKLGNKHKSASKDKDDSYSNDLTNIARGVDAVNPDAENQVSCYIEGIGTEDEKEDSILSGVALGIGSTGVIEKVVKGCKLAANDLYDKFQNIKKTINLKINVFGFSRGATAARHFVHVANQPARKDFRNGFKKIEISPPKKSKEATFIIDNTDHKSEAFIDKYGYFGACLLERKLKINYIEFNFAGLYDTVASYGVNHRGLKVGDVTLIEDDTEQLGLDTIGKEKVQFVLQLAADDEYRENFDLTNINSTGLHGLQFTFPGVHSDIGGSYGDGDKEISVLYCEKSTDNIWELNQIKKKCEEFKKIVVEEGWYKENELEIKPFTQKDVNYDRWWNKSSSFYGLVGTRKLSNHYDRIPLKYMFHYSKEQGGVEYLEKRLNIKHRMTDAFIESVDYQLLAYVRACNDIRNRYITEKKYSLSKDYLKELEAVSYLDYIDDDDLKKLRNKYLHWSVKSNQIGLDPQRNRDAPNTSEALTAKYRKRHIQNG